MPSEEIFTDTLSITDILFPKKKYYRVAELDELEINQMKLIKMKGKQVVLCRSEEGYFALNDKCPHKGSSLSRGVMICSTVHCIMHGSQFDVKTGSRKAGPSKKDAETYKVTIRDSGVYLFI